ncbi:MAG: FAD-binding oxidoreductase [Candidatus Dormibacteraeota bacterium]|nr:FAD-binding oxidoreductase [Candidatus Dormibacteraeota bacterium]MBV9526014.1 FAD-binding oxidoreductase [Candidatus Dormibacteraeota bacterium]
MDSTLRARLNEAAGRGAVASSGDVVIPATVDGLAAAVRVCDETGTRIRVSSGADAGEKADGGVVLSLKRMKAVSAAPAQLTLRAEAGATVDEVRRAAQQARLAVVGLGTARAQHVGSLIARGEVPRRALCGVEAVLPGGEQVRFGGGVLKDVVGYDLPALLLGSMGRLALITAVTFRLEPESARTPVSPPPGPAPEAAHALVAAAFDPQGLLQPGT